MTLPSLVRPSRPVPAELRSNFLHLYLDIAWYGVLSGTAVAFLSVYAARLGASPLQVGLISAGPAAVNLIFTLPAGRWLETRPLGPAVFWTSVLHRFFYLLWVIFPLLLAPYVELWALIATTLLMSVPGTALAVGFNALYADAVPVEWRGHVSGMRNALLSVTFIFATLLAGQILERLPFPTGYQVVFAIGFMGAALSSLHLALIRVPKREHPPRNGPWNRDLARPGRLRPVIDSSLTSVGLRFLLRSPGRSYLRMEILRGPFGRVVAVLFAFHLTQFLAIPLFPLAWVNELGFSDDVISLGQACFYLTVFVGSTQLSRIAARLGNQRVTALGVIMLALYPLLTAVMQGPALLYVASLIGGLAWSLTGGAIANYILDKTPPDDRPAYLAWYNLSLNAGILVGSLGGPLLAGATGITAALLIAAAGRLVSGVLIWRWG
jgi:MFS family permease